MLCIKQFISYRICFWRCLAECSSSSHNFLGAFQKVKVLADSLREQVDRPCKISQWQLACRYGHWMKEDLCWNAFLGVWLMLGWQEPWEEWRESRGCWWRTAGTYVCPMGHSSGAGLFLRASTISSSWTMISGWLAISGEWRVNGEHPPWCFLVTVDDWSR